MTAVHMVRVGESVASTPPRRHLAPPHKQLVQAHLKGWVPLRNFQESLQELLV